MLSEVLLICTAVTLAWKSKTKKRKVKIEKDYPLMHNNLSHIVLLHEFKLELGDRCKYLQMDWEVYLELLIEYSYSKIKWEYNNTCNRATWMTQCYALIPSNRMKLWQLQVSCCNLTSSFESDYSWNPFSHL
jgi:hypothetical protein